MAKAIDIVRRKFPDVKKVVDAKHNLIVDVTPRDSRTGNPHDHTDCALARACLRQLKPEGVLVSMSTAYVVKGTTATRYRLSESATREVVAFDRRAGFAPGSYSLCSPDPSDILGERAKRAGTHSSKDKTATGNLIKRFRHVTTGVRTRLA